MRKSSLLAVSLAALVAAPVIGQAPAARAQNPLSSIFGCEASGQKQAGGAVAGAVLGGILASQNSSKKKKTQNMVLGAAVGAAAGSYIGCRMQVSDQRRAEAATQQALSNGQSTTWNNPETGASGRVTMVSSKTMAPGYDQPASLNGVRFAPGVEPQGPYLGATGQYQAPNRANLRATANPQARVVSQLQAGETFDALARVRAYPDDFILAGRNGVAIGYVSDSVVRPLTNTYAGAAGGRGQLCRTFDQTVTTGQGETQTQRYTACQNANGEWVVQG